VSANSIHPKYRSDIDGLRAVAILSVIVFHAFPDSVPGGFTGVDIFFVISGFLISTIIFSGLEQGRFSLKDFYIRRVRRIFPALILVLVACLGFGLFVLFADEYKQLSTHTVAGAIFVQNFVLWRESGYFDNVAETKPLLHLWSLAIEEQFYIFWPLLLAAVWKRHWSFLRITALFAVGSFALNVYLIRHNTTSAFYLPFSRFWELMLGGVLAYMALHRPDVIARYRNTQSALGFALVVAGLVLLHRGRDFPGWWALLPAVGAFFIISAHGSWLNEKLLANKPMVWVGLISYPLYLWHWPILTYLKIVEGDASAVARGMALGLSVLLAWLSYRYVEKPIRFGGSPRARAVALLQVMGVVAGVGLLGVAAGGFPWRSVGGVQFTPKSYDLVTNYRLGKCFLGGAAHQKFDEICDARPDGRPVLVLWGDSYAASLYQGLLKQSKITRFNLAQYTTAGCPPVTDFEVEIRPGCLPANAAVLTNLAGNKPDTVILAANWMLYDGKHDEGGKPWNVLPAQKLVNTISKLRSMGVGKVIVVGQLPTFTQAQPKIGARNFVPGVTARTFRNFNDSSAVADRRIREMVQGSGAEFVSPIDTLCDSSGCLISASPNELVPLAWDHGHLTTEGSAFFVESALAPRHLPFPGNSRSRQ